MCTAVAHTPRSSVHPSMGAGAQAVGLQLTRVMPDFQRPSRPRLTQSKRNLSKGPIRKKKPNSLIVIQKLLLGPIILPFSGAWIF